MSACASNPIWFDPACIGWKIAPVQDLVGIAGGDWDIERRFKLDATAKYRAIAQRFDGGQRWEDTDLFRRIYAKRFACGESVRGCDTIEALAAQYYERVDGMFRDMRTYGFRLDLCHSLPEVLIGRDGDYFLGNQGNHRVAIAQLLSLNRIAGTIRCTHEKAK